MLQYNVQFYLFCDLNDDYLYDIHIDLLTCISAVGSWLTDSCLWKDDWHKVLEGFLPKHFQIKSSLPLLVKLHIDWMDRLIEKNYCHQMDWSENISSFLNGD